MLCKFSDGAIPRVSLLRKYNGNRVQRARRTEVSIIKSVGRTPDPAKGGFLHY